MAIVPKYLPPGAALPTATHITDPFPWGSGPHYPVALPTVNHTHSSNGPLSPQMPMYTLHAGDRIRMRLNMMPYDAFPMDLTVHGDADKGYVVVLVGGDNKVTVLEDDAALFPSDTLVTQLRLIFDQHNK